MSELVSRALIALRAVCITLRTWPTPERLN